MAGLAPLDQGCLGLVVTRHQQSLGAVTVGVQDIRRGGPRHQQGGSELRSGRPQVVVQAFGHPAHRVFGNAIHRAGAGRQAEHRAGVEDQALLSVLDHARHEGLYAVQHAVHIDRHDPLPVLVGDVPDVTQAAGHTGVIAHDMHPIKGIEGPVGQAKDGRFVRDIGLDR